MKLFDFLSISSARDKAKERGIELEIDDLLEDLDGRALSDAVNDRFGELCKAQDEVGTIKLKTVQPYFSKLMSGEKQFEVRRNDRNFQVGQRLSLAEWNIEHQRYTGACVIAEIIYILDNPEFCKDGYVVMQLKIIAKYGA